MRQPQELTVPISLIVASVVLIVVILVAIVVVVVVCQRHQSGNKRVSVILGTCNYNSFKNFRCSVHRMDV